MGIHGKPDADTQVEISLLDYFERRFEHEREFITQRLDSMDEARKLQALEYARRLDELNHANQVAVLEAARVLPRETFEDFKGTYDEFRERTDKGINTMSARFYAITTLVGIAIAGFALILRFFRL